MPAELTDLTIPPQSEVKIELSVTARLNITEFTAQRQVSRLLLEQVGNLLYGERPTLVVGRRLIWRVPVWVALPTRGPLGQVGALEVDAQTGEILFTPALLADLAERGNVLAQTAASNPG